MLTIPGNAKILLCAEPVDMRKSFEGLGATVQRLFSSELTSGDFFVFINRTRSCMKVLYWDGDGFAIWYKRLEKGTFLRRKDETIHLDRREFLMLLEGITPKKCQARYKISKG